MGGCRGITEEASPKGWREGCSETARLKEGEEGGRMISRQEVRLASVSRGKREQNKSFLSLPSF